MFNVLHISTGCTFFQIEFRIGTIINVRFIKHCNSFVLHIWKRSVLVKCLLFLSFGTSKCSSLFQWVFFNLEYDICRLDMSMIVI